LKEFGLYKLFNIKIEVPELVCNYNGNNEIVDVISQYQNSRFKGDLGLGKRFKICINQLL